MSSPAKTATYSAYSPAETKLIQIAFKHMKSIPEVSFTVASVWSYPQPLTPKSITPNGRPPCHKYIMQAQFITSNIPHPTKNSKLTHTAQCDWDAIANEYGYKSASLARAKYGLAMNKYKTSSALPDGTPTTSAAAKTPSRKRKAPGEAANGGAKRGRKPKVLSAVEVQENEDDAEVAEQKVKVEPKEEHAIQAGSDTESAGKEDEEEV
ncbi:hypothetical protein MMC18_000048 [Xylographa bjoerkii]|nr:hypothetical protein [Xylographa bjoerkii]